MGSEESAGEEPEHAEDAETDRGQFPASATLGLGGGQLFGFQPLLPFLLHLGLEDFDGIGRDRTDDALVGVEGAARGADRQQHESEDGEDGLHGCGWVGLVWDEMP